MQGHSVAICPFSILVIIGWVGSHPFCMAFGTSPCPPSMGSMLGLHSTEWPWYAGSIQIGFGGTGSVFYLLSHVKMVLANERRPYLCNIFFHWLKPFSHELAYYIES